MKNWVMPWVVTALVVPALAGQSPMTPDEALEALVEGNKRFAADESRPKPRGEGLRRTLSSGENPYAIVVTCSDSRVSPEHIFNTGLGELFVVRVSGNVCDPESLASIEYAATLLGASVCAVIAHSDCEAVHAAIEDEADTNASSHLLARIQPSVRRAARDGLHGGVLQKRVEIENAHETVAEVMRRSPQVRELVRLRRLRLVPGHYDLETGLVEWLSPRPIENPTARAPKKELTMPVMPPHVALSMLQAGHRRFLNSSKSRVDLGETRRHQLLNGQRPIAVVLTCADSRVPPELLFDVGLGEVFVVRVAGNVVSDEALASIEHGIADLGASLLIAMGHQNCGTVSAAVTEAENPHLSTSMRQLLARLEPSITQAQHEGFGGGELINRAVELNASRTLTQARARSSVVREAEARGKLALLPVSYELDTGDLHWLDFGWEDPPAAPGGAAASHGTNYGETTHHEPEHHGDHGHHGSHAEEHHAPAGVVLDHHAPDDHGTAGHHEPHASDHHGDHGHHGVILDHDDGHGHATPGHDAHETHEYPGYDTLAADPHAADQPGKAASSPPHGSSALQLAVIAFLVSASGVGALALWLRKGRDVSRPIRRTPPAAA